MAEVWGPISDNGHPAKLGIATTITQTPTTVDVTVKVIFWAYHGVEDASNSFYYDIGTGVSSASTYIGKKNICLTNGYNWTYNLKQELYSNTYSYTRGTTDVTINIYAKLAGVEYGGGTTYVNTSFTIPHLDTYTIYYYSNDGSGECRTQTKYYGQNVTFISAPSRYGYTFIGWTPWTENVDGSLRYQPGEVYSINASLALLAVWAPNTFTVTFDANGGTGGPSSQTKNYGEPLTLSSEIPSKTYCNFLGWSITKGSDLVTYQSGGAYTDDASITLYAVWELAYQPPQVSNAKVSRCTSEGVVTDDGEYFRLDLSYKCYEIDGNEANCIYIITYKTDDGGEYQELGSLYINGVEGTFSEVVTEVTNTFDPESQYTIEIHVFDKTGEYSKLTLYLPSQKFPIDVLKGGTGLGIGTSAKRAGVAEVAYSLKPVGNRYAMWSRGVTDAAGYVKMARITFTGNHPNWPITFVITSRYSQAPMTVHIRFGDTTTNTPPMDSITYEGVNIGAFMCPVNKLTTGSSEWDFIVEKKNQWDTLAIQDWWMSPEMESLCTVSFYEHAVDGTDPGTLYSSTDDIKPYYRATPLVNTSILDCFMPVGYILILYSQADPNTMYPGTTWERINNAFLWACDSNGAIGQTGGEKMHRLTVDEIPSHTHYLHADASPNGANMIMNPASNGTTSQDRVEANSYNWPYTTWTGGNQYHNNMPPYIQVAMWRRTN